MLDWRRKAAIVVQCLLSHGERPPLAALPEDTQLRLAREIGRIDLIDRVTLHAVLDEFAEHLESVGLSATGGTEAALAALAGHISPAAAARLKAEASGQDGSDPWTAIASLPPEALVTILGAEAVEVAAVILSKLPIPLAARTLALLPGEQARRITFAVSRTSAGAPAAVRRIGHAIATEHCATPPPAFALPPGERLGAILNSSAQTTRDGLLDGLDAEDQRFAAEVRRAIFTFAHLPLRLKAGDVPRVLRLVEPRVIAVALAAARAAGDKEQEAADFIYASISQRMGESLREEVDAVGTVRRAEGEAAQAEIVAAIRERAVAGEVTLIDPDEE